MGNAELTQLLQSVIMLSVLLLIGTVLRAKVPIFQKCFLPASVIGGFVGLIIGPIVWQGGGVPIPEEWIKTWTALPGVLIVPVVASVPLGMKFGGGKKGGAVSASANIVKMFAILFLASIMQAAIGIGTNAAFSSMQPELGLYSTFGYELPSGYSGGHGTAGVLGGNLQSIGYEHWEIAQGVTTTTATFGLVGGMIIGIIFINIMARKGKTALLKKPGDIPAEMLKGVQMDPAKQPPAGKETTFNSSIESLTLHLGIILAGCGLAYLLMGWVKSLGIGALASIPIWAYAIVVMFFINFLLNKTGLIRLVDNKTKSKISGSLSDFAIVAAIASMPIHAVLKYAAPILVMCLLGYILTFLSIYLCCKLAFKDCQVERTMAMWGSATGVFLNGLMLLKICDPEYKLPVLNDYSVGFSFTSITAFIMMPTVLGLMINSGLGAAMILQVVCIIVSIVLLLISTKVTNSIDKKAGVSGTEAA